VSNGRLRKLAYAKEFVNTTKSRTRKSAQPAVFLFAELWLEAAAGACPIAAAASRPVRRMVAQSNP